MRHAGQDSKGGTPWCGRARLGGRKRETGAYTSQSSVSPKGTIKRGGCGAAEVQLWQGKAGQLAHAPNRAKGYVEVCLKDVCL